MPDRRANKPRKPQGVPVGDGVVVQQNAIGIPPLYPWQQRVRRALVDYRFVVVFSARQIGKTELAVLTAIEEAMNGGDVWWIAPLNRFANAGYDKLVKYMQMPPFNQPYRSDSKVRMVEEYKQRRRFTFHNGEKVGTIEVLSVEDPTSAVSATNTLVVFDEFGRGHPDAWYEGAYSTLTVRRGRALLISNPRGKNWAWNLWRMGDPELPEYNPEYRSFTFSQFDNPDLDPLWVASQQQTMTRRQYEREVLGLCTDDGGEVFVGVRRAARVIPGTRQYDPTHVYTGGLDISGGRHDWHVLMVEDKTTREQVAMLRFSTQELSVMTRTLLDAQAIWNMERIDGDETTIGIYPMREFQNAGLPIRPVNLNWVNKRALIEDYAAEIELDKIALLNDPVVVGEHEAYEAEETASGHVKYNSPKGGTDDSVIAGALAHRAATHEEARDGAAVHLLRHSGLYGSALHDGSREGTKKRTYPSWSKRTSRSAHNG